MKKIQLTDGLPSSISAREQGTGVTLLSKKIEEICNESGLSYVCVNKALYLADKELYMKKINS